MKKVLPTDSQYDIILANINRNLFFKTLCKLNNILSTMALYY